jgi:hypothetical protein
MFLDGNCGVSKGRGLLLVRVCSDFGVCVPKPPHKLHSFSVSWSGSVRVSLYSSSWIEKHSGVYSDDI